MKTLTIEQAAHCLCVHKETIRRMAVSGEVPAVKIGRSWVFIEEDLAAFIRSKYACVVTSQGAVQRSNNKWRSTSETILGGLASPIKEKEYREALGLATK
ncbi:TPA: helix-turn-helix domain-containing protein [Legionella pneumophila subsp. pneumophila]|nr:helix-turn-helix domain-containing protein [Legionella pneumophila]HAT8967807.1 helix-turn-helix domain-containing protein [Legionella pneumophila subsp. pneumophila]